MCTITLLSTACSDANEEFIEGSWYYRSAHLDSVSGETYLEVRWDFYNGTFGYYACCFNVNTHVNGRYDIMESQDNIITLKLFNVNGVGFPDPAEVRIKIDQDKDTLSIQGTGPFSPVAPDLC